MGGGMAGEVMEGPDLSTSISPWGPPEIPPSPTPSHPTPWGEIPHGAPPGPGASGTNGGGGRRPPPHFPGAMSWGVWGAGLPPPRGIPGQL